VGEEWRLLIEFDGDGALEAAAEQIVAVLGEEIELHEDDDGLVAYAGTPEEAHAAERRLRQALETRGLAHLEPHVDHWSHDDQEWQHATGGPTEPDDKAEENDTDDEPEDAGPRTVAVSLSHHHEAKQLADQLRNEGWDASSSWHTVEIRTRSRDDAESLVAELEARAPDAEVAIAE
jgi:hypothetical protein